MVFPLRALRSAGARGMIPEREKGHPDAQNVFRLDKGSMTRYNIVR